MRLRWTGLLMLAAGISMLALSGCATSSGDPAAAIPNARIASAYIPLYRGGFLSNAEGVATVIAPGFAVTNAHNENLLGNPPILAKPAGYDLLFYGTERRIVPFMGTVRAGLKVTAYGQGSKRELRIAQGVIRPLPNPAGEYFVFEGNAGPGFSGGPVIDEEGRLLGIVYGYKDERGTRLNYAYDIARVLSLFQAAQRSLPLDLN